MAIRFLSGVEALASLPCALYLRSASSKWRDRFQFGLVVPVPRFVCLSTNSNWHLVLPFLFVNAGLKAETRTIVFPGLMCASALLDRRLRLLSYCMTSCADIFCFSVVCGSAHLGDTK